MFSDDYAENNSRSGSQAMTAIQRSVSTIPSATTLIGQCAMKFWSLLLLTMDCMHSTCVNACMAKRLKTVNESRNKLLILGEPACPWKSDRGASGGAIGQNHFSRKAFTI
jgi:hypothetical protein